MSEKRDSSDLVAGAVGALLVATSVGLARWLGARETAVSQGDRVLLVGDGVGQALAAPLSELALGSNVDLHALLQPGTRVQQWAGSPLLQQRLQQTSPTLVLAALGALDAMDGPQHVSRQLAQVDQLRRQVERAGARLAWVGPLRQKAAGGFADALAATLPKGSLYDARRVVVQRGPDGMTPTARGAVGLAGAVWRWLG